MIYLGETNIIGVLIYDTYTKNIYLLKFNLNNY